MAVPELSEPPLNGKHSHSITHRLVHMMIQPYPNTNDCVPILY